MDTEFFKYLANLGGVGILAAVFYYQNNKNAKDYAAEVAKQSKEFADRIEALLNVEKGRTEMLVSLVKDNTAQTVSNTEVLRALHKRLDKEGVE